MKVAIITDQHFGARKSSKFLHDHFKRFYDDIFFPYLEEHNIKVVVDMGDTFDNRRSIDLWALEWAKENYYDRLHQMGITVHTIVGNHTAYYKNTNQVNSVGLLLKQYDNVIVYPEVTEVKLGNLNTLFIPWINNENFESTVSSGTLNSTDSELIAGTSWKTVWTANYLRSSVMSSRDTITLDRTTEKSSI
jgi:hypothetical protein